MIIKLKTKEKVIYDVIKQDSDFVYLEVSEVKFNGKDYFAVIEYLVNKNYEPNTVFNRFVFFTGIIKFSKEEADVLFKNLEISGDTFSTKFINLITEAAKYQLGVSNILGLTSNDWELIIKDEETI